MASMVHQPQEDAEFAFILARADVPVLAYFHGVWPKAAAACKEMDPLVGEVADAYHGRLVVVRADIARCPGPVRRYGVTGAPSLVLIDRGEATAAVSGPMSRAALGEFLDAGLRGRSRRRPGDLGAPADGPAVRDREPDQGAP